MPSSLGIWALISWVSGTLGTLGKLEYNNQIRFLVTEWEGSQVGVVLGTRGGESKRQRGWEHDRECRQA